MTRVTAAFCSTVKVSWRRNVPIRFLIPPCLIERDMFRAARPARHRQAPPTASHHINPCSVQMFGDAIRKLLPAHREIKQTFRVIQRSPVCRNSRCVKMKENMQNKGEKNIFRDKILEHGPRIYSQLVIQNLRYNLVPINKFYIIVNLTSGT